MEKYYDAVLIIIAFIIAVVVAAFYPRIKQFKDFSLSLIQRHQEYSSEEANRLCFMLSYKKNNCYHCTEIYIGKM